MILKDEISKIAKIKANELKGYMFKGGETPTMAREGRRRGGAARAEAWVLRTALLG